MGMDANLSFEETELFRADRNEVMLTDFAIYLLQNPSKIRTIGGTEPGG
jgi:hypothetical protein